jgi:hypothetical protein
MAKAQSSTVDTPGMASNSSKKTLQPPKSTGKQTTLHGFFSKVSQTPTQKRVEARSTAPPTPLPSSEIGDDVSPTRPPVRQNGKEISGLRTPVTPAAEKNGMEMDVDLDLDSSGLRKVVRFVDYVDDRNVALLIIMSYRTRKARKNVFLRNVTSHY